MLVLFRLCVSDLFKLIFVCAINVALRWIRRTHFGGFVGFLRIFHYHVMHVNSYNSSSICVGAKNDFTCKLINKFYNEYVSKLTLNVFYHFVNEPSEVFAFNQSFCALDWNATHLHRSTYVRCDFVWWKFDTIQKLSSK